MALTRKSLGSQSRDMERAQLMTLKLKGGTLGNCCVLEFPSRVHPLTTLTTRTRSPFGDATTIGWKAFRSIVLRSEVNLIDCEMINDLGVQAIYLIIAPLSKEDIFKQALIRLLNALQVRA